MEGSMYTHDYQTVVATAYDQAPTLIMSDCHAWDTLADETMAHYAAIARCISIVPVDMAEPYATAVAMFADVARGRIFVSDTNHNHPVWTREVNRAFRVVHDVLGHCTVGASFTWEGELAAWARHESQVVSPIARAALFTEAVGQVAWALSPEYGQGQFGVQKVALLPQWMRWQEVYACAA